MSKAEQKRATVGFFVSLIAGILILLNGILFGVVGSIFTVVAGLEELGITVMALGLFLGVVIADAVLVYTPGKEVVGGAMVLMFSLLSILIGGGYIGIIGLIMGVIGGALAIAKK